MSDELQLDELLCLQCLLAGFDEVRSLRIRCSACHLVYNPYADLGDAAKQTRQLVEPPSLAKLAAALHFWTPSPMV